MIGKSGRKGPSRGTAFGTFDFYRTGFWIIHRSASPDSHPFTDVVENAA